MIDLFKELAIWVANKAADRLEARRLQKAQVAQDIADQQAGEREYQAEVQKAIDAQKASAARRGR